MMLALTHRDAGLTPGTALLPTHASLLERRPDGVRADGGQTIRGPTQSLLQRRQGPSGRAIPLAIGDALEFGQNALLLLRAIAEGRAPAMAGNDSNHAFPIETRDPVANGVSGMPPRQDSRLSVALARRDGQQGARADHWGGGCASGATQASEFVPFLLP